MKLIDADKLRAEIERLYDGEAPKHDQQCDFDDGYFTGIDAISKFLDTLSEEPDKSLEEAAREYATTHLRNNEFPTADSAFIAGAEWQKSQMLKEAVEGVVRRTNNHKHTSVRYQSFYGTYRYFYGIADKQLKAGDKVKIIIVKEED